MTRRFNGRPALPPKAKAEILEVLFANMEISGDEIAAILKKHHVCIRCSLCVTSFLSVSG